MFFGLCLVKLLFHSALAMRAVKAAATGLAQAADRALALRAGFACAVINGAVKLEAAGPTVAVHIVTNAAAAGGNRILQGGADGFGESRVVFILDFEFGTVERWWSGNWNIGKGISDMLVDELLQMQPVYLQVSLDGACAATNASSGSSISP